MTPAPHTAAAAPLTLRAMLYYGGFGLPLAMVALPIYVYAPQFYAQRSGLGLAVIGAVLLAARLAAACIDPLLGMAIARGGARYARAVVIALPLLLAGFGALFHPPAWHGAAAAGWFLAALVLVYGGYGLAAIAHQSWGAALSRRPGERGRLAATREACGLLGVMLAAGLAATLGYEVLYWTFAGVLAAGAVCLLARAPRPRQPSLPGSGSGAGAGSALAPGSVSASQALAAPGQHAVPPGRRATLLLPFASRPFRALFAVMLVNGVAAAIPATLFLFFAQDRLHLGSSAGLFLLLYFASAGISMAPWAALALRWGEARAWVAGMLLSALVFVWAWKLGAGDALAFGAICALSGLALGADLALPPALLAGVIAGAGHGARHEAAYLGWWNWGVQMTLALAAGLALPLLQWQGYMPGGADGRGLDALALAYALLPCVMKLLAAALLWRAPLRDC